MLAVTVGMAAAGCRDESRPSSNVSETAATGTLTPDQQPGDVGQLAPLVFQALRAPIPFTGSDNRTHLAYQLTIQNGGPSPVRVDKVLVRDGDDPDTVIDSMSGPALDSQLGLLAAPVEPLRNATFESSQAGALWVDATLDSDDSIPAKLEHRGRRSTNGKDTVTAAQVAVSSAEPADLAAPLIGPAAGSTSRVAAPASRTTATRSFPRPGQLYASQEFAIDFMGLDSRGRLFHGPKSNPTSYAAYDAPVLAVSDAKVVAASDGLPDQVPADPKPVSPERADGNFVMLDLGDGRYANYAHLKPRSLKVKPGDEVEAGEQLGLVGNTGQTETPHLHIHVMDRPLLAEAVGLPYEFERFNVEGVADVRSVSRAISSDSSVEIDTSGAGEREDQLPLEMTVLDFPQPGG